jgi:fermentation-respiration switch protein FrsA (DUF1100 family)
MSKLQRMTPFFHDALRDTIVLTVVVIAALLLVLWTLQRRLMYFPIAAVPSLASLGGGDVHPVTFDTADGLRLNGWFFPVARAGPRDTVLVFNGNAGNRAYRVPLATALVRRGFQVLLFDYRGFGGNPGTPTERGLARDARAAREYLVSRRDVDAARLIYFGESLGTAVAVDLATEHPPAALVLRSPFTSMADVGQYHYWWLPVRLLIRDRYNTLERIGRLKSPLLVIAGERDSIVPIDQSRRVYDSATSSPKRFLSIPNTDHNDDALLDGDAMIEEIARFLAR